MAKKLNKKLNKKQLEELVQSLAWNERFGCYTRPGLEKFVWGRISGSVQYVVFIDVDDMHGLNQEHGYEGVNQIVKNSMAIRSTDYIAGQWFSGDEFAVFITKDPLRGDSAPLELCQRLQAAFRSNGASATFGIAAVASQDISQVVKPAFDLVQNAKRTGQRGTINMVQS